MGNRPQGYVFTALCYIFLCVFCPTFTVLDILLYLFVLSLPQKTVSLLLFTLFLSLQKAYLCLEYLFFSEKILAWKMMNKNVLFTSLLAFVFFLCISSYLQIFCIAFVYLLTALLKASLTVFDSFDIFWYLLWQLWQLPWTVLLTASCNLVCHCLHLWLGLAFSVCTCAVCLNLCTFVFD